MAGYGAKSQDIKVSKPFDAEIYQNVRLVKVEKKLQKEFNTLQYTFVKPDTAKWNLTIFEPKKTLKNTIEQVENAKTLAGARAVYIPKIVYKKDIDLILPEDAEWVDFVDAAVGLFDEKYDDVDLELKLVGNFYNNAATFGVTQYFGWLRRMDDEEKPLEYSSGERKANGLYYANVGKAVGVGTAPDNGGTSSFIKPDDED